MYQGTRITEPPTFTGPFGQAWRVRLPPPDQRPLPAHAATVGGFMVCAPQAHPFWTHWMVSMIHLRPIPNEPLANLMFPEATHELMILALDPEQPLPGLDVDDRFRITFLTPIDVREQFAARDDVTADTILELSVRAIVDGHLSPDQDYRARWKGAIAETAAHFQDGQHGAVRPS